MSEKIRLVCCKDDSSFTSEDRLFIFQFPQLYAVCSTYGISREEVYKAGKNATIFYNRDEFETGLRMCIVNLIEYGKPCNENNINSRSYKFYYNLKFVGVELYKDEDNNIKIRTEE